jgi:glyoxylase I family protein
MIQGFHHLAMNVSNFDESKGFYIDVLGFSAAKEWGEAGKRAIMLDAGNGNYVELFEKPQTETAEGTLLHFALRSDNCDEIIEKVRKAGATITVEPKNVDILSNPAYPVRIAFFKGPAGETVEIFEER